MAKRSPKSIEERIETFAKAELPVNITMPGWKTDISGCRAWEELPEAAREYIAYLEKAVGVKIRYVSVGAEREQYFER